jgi:YD repeat-containing protein
LGRLASETNQLGQARQYTYDANGNRLTETDRDNRTRQFDYDHLNRPTAERWFASGNPAQLLYIDNMAYDLGNELTTNADTNSANNNAPISSYTYGYDGLGRLISTDNAGTTGAPRVVLSVPSGGYDANGNRLALSAAINGMPDFSNTYVYDTLNRQTGVQQTGAGGNAVAPKRVDLTYDAVGQLATVTRYSDLSGTSSYLVAASGYTFDADGRLTNLNHTVTTASGTTAIFG